MLCFASVEGLYTVDWLYFLSTQEFSGKAAPSEDESDGAVSETEVVSFIDVSCPPQLPNFSGKSRKVLKLKLKHIKTCFLCPGVLLETQ